MAENLVAKPKFLVHMAAAKVTFKSKHFAIKLRNVTFHLVPADCGIKELFP